MQKGVAERKDCPEADNKADNDKFEETVRTPKLFPFLFP
jgi:hypothetical protein